MKTFNYGVPWPNSLMWPPHQHFETEMKDPRGLSLFLKLYDFIMSSEKERSKAHPGLTGI